MVIVDRQPSLRLGLGEQSLTLPPANPADFIFSRKPFSNTLPSIESNPFEQKRRAYMVNFIKPYDSPWEAWRQGGLLQPDAQNIVEHHVVAAVIGHTLTKAIGLSPQAVADVTLALLVHDADKLIELKKLEDALPKKKAALRRQTVGSVLLQGHKMLKRIVPPHIQELSAANVPDRVGVHPDIRYQIVHYVDAILDGSRLVSPEKRMQAGISNDGGRKQDLARLRYETHEGHLRIGSGEYIKLQTRLANEEAARFVSLLKARNSELSYLTASNLPGYLQGLFDREVEQFAA